MNLKKWEKWNVFTYPLTSIGKDFVDTFKPYKTNRHWRYDALQPLYGVGHILIGSMFLLTALFMMLMAAGGIFGTIAVAYAYPLVLIGILALPVLIDLGSIFIAGKAIGCVVGVLGELKGEVVEKTMMFIFTLSGFPILIRGISQVATTPLTWLLKIPLRLILTEAYGYQKIEEDRGVNRLVDLRVLASQEARTNDIKKIDQEIKEKINKAKEQGRETPQDLLSALNNGKSPLLFFRAPQIDIPKDFPETVPFFAVEKYKDLPNSKKWELVAELDQDKKKNLGYTQTQVAETLKKHSVFVNRAALTMMMINRIKLDFGAPLNQVPRDIWKLIGEHARVTARAHEQPKDEAPKLGL